MEPNQQQQKTNVQPSLAELDQPPVQEQKKPEEEKPDPTLDKNPTNTPSPDPAKPEQKSEEKEPVVVEEEATNAEEEEASSEDFWSEVSKLRGDDFKFEFPQEIEDPLTPQGVHHIIKTAEDRAIERFEERLSKEDARGYAYLLHRANGGSDEDFFADKTEVLPELETLKGSVDLQQAFYKRSLIRKGVDPEDADLIIKNAIDKQKLFGLVETSYNAQKKAQEDQLIQLQKIAEQNEQRVNQLVSKMASTLQERILQNKGLDITIPDARRAEFLQFVNQHLDMDTKTGRWFLTQELTSDNMSNVLQAMYYNMVKGNMEDIISNKVNQKVASKFRLKMQSDKTKKTSSPDPDRRTNEKPGVQPAISEL